jgi:hypothetical protein
MQLHLLGRQVPNLVQRGSVLGGLLGEQLQHVVSAGRDLHGQLLGGQLHQCLRCGLHVLDGLLRRWMRIPVLSRRHVHIHAVQPWRLHLYRRWNVPVSGRRVRRGLVGLRRSSEPARPLSYFARWPKESRLVMMST